MIPRSLLPAAASLVLLAGCAESPAAPSEPIAAGPRFDTGTDAGGAVQTTSGGWFGDGNGGGAVTSANSAPADSADSAERSPYTLGSGS